jgi:hypothetical protein
MKEATSMMTSTRCYVSLAILLATLVNPSFADKPLTRVEIAKIGEDGTALVEIKLPGRRGGFGSAFCIHPSGLFITNEHVAQGDISIILKPGSKEEKVYKAKIVRSDKEQDLALLRIEDVKDLPTLSLGSDEKLEKQMELLAVGFPFGDALATDRKGYPEVSINSGRISALRRKNDALHRIQLDAALNPGNSGGPVLDENGKVVGVVVSGIRGSGVNQAIPVSILSRFVARPDIHFAPPQVHPATIYRPVLFEAMVLPVIKPTPPITVELVLKAGKGKERTVRMDGAADGKYQAKVVLLPPPPDGATVQLLASFENSILNATTADRTFKVGGREVKLSEVARIQFRPAVRVLLHDGKAVEGEVSGLEAVPVRVGEQSVPVNLVKATAVLFGPASEADQVSYTLVVRQGEKEFLRQTESLAVEELLPSPAAMLKKLTMTRQLEKFGLVRVVRLPNRFTYHTGFSPDGRYYLVAGMVQATNDIRLWEVETGKVKLNVPGNEGVAFTPDGKHLLAPDPDKNLNLWELATGEKVRTFRGHTDGIFLPAISPDGKLVLSGSVDQTVRLWDLASGKELEKWSPHAGGRPQVLFSPDGKHWVTWAGTAADRTVWLWDAKTLKRLRKWEHPVGLSGYGYSYGFAGGGNEFVALGEDMTFRWWNVGTGEQTQSLKLDVKGLNASRLSPDGRRFLYSSTDDKAVHLIELPSGKEVARFPADPVPYGGMSFSPDGRYAAGTTADGLVYLWRLPDPAGKP